MPVHQDLSIPVREKVPHPALSGWSLKQGTCFVQPPLDVLQQLVAVRVHLDGGTPGRLRPDVEDALRAHVLTDATYRSATVGGDPVAVPHP